ncbi:hypothetical protein AAJ72_11115 [Citromicrobium sp. RCC1885]|uniref:hypothetical protein n=1 Tax=unclassified Citromicrobium TaxID=2630544 RepID=UPI0006C8F5A3|nr:MULTISPECIES: hypothetical protein [unclassified Citromicrobium]KPM22444.1 hypothetical protein AAJ72_11115 [Citromicrobium sp. RCC1885]KPM25927.1 hypothetical protein AAJ74_11855 [Citromicrobium sp. RCC1878]MAO03165.1 hypothetical protein [Citromicrobium sp.]OAM07999.1 hypothetical protein A0U43_12315 [Citromicrobium sp. RCC1897]|tara:strand:+ start:13539 stop:15017 length:1479 start_codon:yes stop_codon:yes gene_type:complete
MFHRSSSDDIDLCQLVEEHQRRALRAINYAPRKLQKHAAKWAKREREILPNRPGIDPYDLVTLVFHEKHYANREYYDAHRSDVLLTRYDKKDFLDRFYNVNVLCHRYFEGAGYDARAIRYSSLPLSHINGFCASMPEDQTLILLNEGVFYILPLLIDVYPDLELADLPVDLTFEELDKEQEYEAFRASAADFFDDFSTLISDRVSPSTLLFDPELRGAARGGFETWKIKEDLRASLRAQLSQTEVKPSAPTKDQLDFYRCRGFFVFLFAHEFSHAYRKHVQIRESDPLLGLPYVEALIEHMTSLGLTHQFEDARQALSAKNFDAGKQPLEIEADADALNILQLYAELNELEDYQFRALLEGVVMAMSIFEFTELMARAILISPQDAVDTHCLDPMARNLLIPSEHPCSLSRLTLALEANDVLPQATRDMIAEIEGQHAVLFEGLWLFLMPRLHHVAQRIRLSPMIQLDGGSMFQGLPVMGHLSTFGSRLKPE